MGFTFKVEARGYRALWPDDVCSLRPVSLHLARDLSQLIQGLVSPGWSSTENEAIASACLTHRLWEQQCSWRWSRESCRASLLLSPGEGRGIEVSQTRFFSTGQRTSSCCCCSLLPPLRWFASMDGGHCGLSPVVIKPLLSWSWSEGQLFLTLGHQLTV